MLNISKGNMYSFVTHTWNAIKGKCYHNCIYCYMKRWGELNQVRLDRKELKTDLGNNNFIFVGSSCDMFADDIPIDWIKEILNYCKEFNNQYLFQSKNPKRILELKEYIPEKSIICTTLETNRYLNNIMVNSPSPRERAKYMNQLDGFKRFVTIEPIIEFDLEEFVFLISICQPEQVNIGADSSNNKLPEPSKEKVLLLIQELNKFTKIENKRNLQRLLS